MAILLPPLPPTLIPTKPAGIGDEGGTLDGYGGGG